MFAEIYILTVTLSVHLQLRISQHVRRESAFCPLKDRIHLPEEGDASSLIHNPSYFRSPSHAGEVQGILLRLVFRAHIM